VSQLRLAELYRLQRWPNKAAMWVWVLPVLFLAFRVLLYATNKSDNSI